MKDGLGKTTNQLAGLKRRPIPTRRKVLYSAMVGLLLLLLAEGASQLTLRICYGGRIPDHERLHEYHPQLGWSNLRNHRVPNRYGENKHATHNSQGIRGEADYSAAVPLGRCRVLCLGDSFTYGVDVDDRDAFPAQLEALCPSIQAINMGVAGYGIDQMYLKYMSEGARFRTDVLLVSFIEDDFCRMKMNAFMTRYPKPQLVPDGDTLKAVNVPVPTWGDDSRTGWLQEFPNRLALVQIVRKVCSTNLNHYQVFPIAERIFDALNDYSRQHHQKLVLAYLPSAIDVRSDQPTEVARQVERIAEQRQIAFFNLTAAFRTQRPEELGHLFVPDGRHYSERGHRLVAEQLLENLRKAFPDLAW